MGFKKKYFHRDFVYCSRCFKSSKKYIKNFRRFFFVIKEKKLSQRRIVKWRNILFRFAILLKHINIYLYIYLHYMYTYLLCYSCRYVVDKLCEFYFILIIKESFGLIMTVHFYYFLFVLFCFYNRDFTTHFIDR